MMHVTDSAKEKILDILYQEKSSTNFRISVIGGGCSGFQYNFALDAEMQEDDIPIDIHPFKILVDSISMQYLDNSSIDYEQKLLSNRFVINNPNSSGTCGCGSSFYV